MRKMTKAAPGYKRQAGFSLTEVAVALSVSGLLVGGVLKSVDMMEQARILKAGALLENTATGHQMFLDQFQYMPGDLAGAKQLIADTLVNGNGDNILTVNSDDQTNDGSTGESYHYWAHLAAAGMGPGARGETAADMVASGIVSGTAIQSVLDGSQYPMFPLGGYLQVISGVSARQSSATASGTARTFTSIDTGGDTSGVTPQIKVNDLFYRIGVAAASGANARELNFAGAENRTTAVNQYDLYRMDLKFDDGRPSTGRMLTTTANCHATDASANIYVPGTNAAATSTSCLVLYRAASTGGSPNIIP